MRNAPGLQWLGTPKTYAIAAPIVSLLSAGTTLLAPRLLDPEAFGAFALLTTLFIYSARSDLGLTQLADRDLAARGGAIASRGVEILQARWTVGLVLLAIALPVAIFIAYQNGRLSPVDAALALVGGTAAMIANGPATVYRAASRLWEFTVAALVLQAGMTAPRLAGLVLAGTTGCFATLAVWYGLFALLFGGLLSRGAKRPVHILTMLHAAIPLFAFNGLWLVYISANRWISASLSPADQFGLFAFGANLAFVGIGLFASVAEVRYPKLLSDLAKASSEDKSISTEREMLRVGLVLAAGIAVAVLIAPRVIPFVFPRFEAATPTTLTLAVSCVPLVVVAWFIPIVIALSSRPWVDAIRIFGPASAILICAMIAGNHIAGIMGQGWACTIGALALLAGLAATMFRLDLLRGMVAIRVFSVQALLVMALSFLVVASSQH
jgi:O-antigen/teichoic acid export membrane protein